MSELKNFTHAMTLDSETGKPMPKTSVQINGSNVIQPVSMQDRYAVTIQTHSGAVVPPSTTNNGVWIDCNGYNSFVVTVTNDAATGKLIDVEYSHDNGTTVHARKASVLSGNTQRDISSEMPVGARHMRVLIYNSDAAPHTFNSHVYLKA